jgi:hypothetical protein
MSADTRQMIEILISLAPWLIFIAFLIGSQLAPLLERPAQPAEPAQTRPKSVPRSETTETNP